MLAGWVGGMETGAMVGGCEVIKGGGEKMERKSVGW